VPALEQAVVQPPTPQPKVQPPASSARPEPRTITAAGESTPGSAQRTWGWISLGAGGVGLAAGGVFALMASRAEADADQECRPDNPTLCSDEGVSLGEQATSNAGVATFAMGLGAALALTGGVLIFTAPRSEPPTTAGLSVGARLGPQDASLGIQGHW
jgi:hypothetical protein